MIPSSMELTYFYEVAIESNLSRASAKLCMSQPSLSLAIKRLELNVGELLFFRHKHGMTLTSAGKKLLTHIKPLLQQWENVKSQMLDSHRAIQGEITLGCPSTLGYYLHGLMAELLTQHRLLSFHLHLDKSPTITKKVIDANIDIGIVTNPLKHPDLIIRQLQSSEMTFWSALTPSRIQNTQSQELVVICDTELPQIQFLLKKWKNCYLKSARILTVNGLEVIAHLTSKGCGVGILPSCFVQMVYPNRLCKVPHAPTIKNELYLIYRKENRTVKAIETVINLLKKGLW